MISKSLVLLGLLSGSALATEHLDLEVVVDGERQLFPLLPGTKCPPGHTCTPHANKIKQQGTAHQQMVGALKSNLKTPLAMSLNWEELGNNLETVVVSNDYCSRRAAMAKAAGLTAGLGLAAVSQPAYAAETKEVKMGTDSGGLQFVPAKVSICKGDSVNWINNKGGPHNVVFDEDNIPAGVSQEKISMEDQLGEPGETYKMQFDVAGEYGYYCEPHRGAGMEATLTVA